MTPLTRVNLQAFTFLFIGAAAGLWHLFTVSSADESDYKDLIIESYRSLSKGAIGDQPAYQIREGVQKDLWGSPDRLHFRLRSVGSELMLVQRSGDRHLEAIESLHQMDCWMQEERMEESQRLRRFTSDYGVYYFPAHRFVAERVQLSLYQMPGRELPVMDPLEEPFLTGTASEVNFSLANRAPSFTAHYLRAIVPTGKLTSIFPSEDADL